MFKYLLFTFHFSLAMRWGMGFDKIDHMFDEMEKSMDREMGFLGKRKKFGFNRPMMGDLLKPIKFEFMIPHKRHYSHIFDKKHHRCKFHKKMRDKIKKLEKLSKRHKVLKELKKKHNKIKEVKGDNEKGKKETEKILEKVKKVTEKDENIQTTVKELKDSIEIEKKMNKEIAPGVSVYIDEINRVSKPNKER